MQPRLCVCVLRAWARVWTFNVLPNIWKRDGCLRALAPPDGSAQNTNGTAFVAMKQPPSVSASPCAHGTGPHATALCSASPSSHCEPSHCELTYHHGRLERELKEQRAVRRKRGPTVQGEACTTGLLQSRCQRCQKQSARTLNGGVGARKEQIGIVRRYD